MKKVIICGLHQESNAFNPVLAENEDFSLVEGKDIIDNPARAGLACEGMIDCLRENGFEPVGGIVRSANSGGPLNKTVVEDFIDRAISHIKAEKGHLRCFDAYARSIGFGSVGRCLRRYY